MNMNDNPTAEQLGTLLAIQDDDAGEHTLWIARDGDVQITVGDDAVWSDPTARIVFAPFEAGVGFVGADAASDPELLADLLAYMQQHWSLAAEAAPGAIMVDLDDPESGSGWIMTDVVPVDATLLANLRKTWQH